MPRKHNLVWSGKQRKQAGNLQSVALDSKLLGAGPKLWPLDHAANCSWHHTYCSSNNQGLQTFEDRKKVLRLFAFQARVMRVFQCFYQLPNMESLEFTQMILCSYVAWLNWFLIHGLYSQNLVMVTGKMDFLMSHAPCFSRPCTICLKGG